MATERIQIAVRLDSWVIEAVKRFAERNKKDFSWALRLLIESELNRRNYFRSDYEPDIIDLPLTNTIQEPNASPDAQNLKIENEKLKRQILDQRAVMTAEQIRQLEEGPGMFSGIQKKPLQVEDFDDIIGKKAT